MQNISLLSVLYVHYVMRKSKGKSKGFWDIFQINLLHQQRGSFDMFSICSLLYFIYCT